MPLGFSEASSAAIIFATIGAFSMVIFIYLRRMVVTDRVPYSFTSFVNLPLLPAAVFSIIAVVDLLFYIVGLQFPLDLSQLVTLVIILVVLGIISIVANIVALLKDRQHWFKVEEVGGGR